jgi:DNA-binding Lrp family transcriptional regulator
MDDNINRQIIRATQAGLPLVSQPYQLLAKQLGIKPNDLMERLTNMQEKGIIRRIGAVPNHYKLGYKHNGMTVWDIDDTQIDHFGELIGHLDFVSHCYHRPRLLPDWPYNFFAMIHSKTTEGAVIQIQHIADLLGTHCRSSDVLYSTKILKKSGLRIKKNVSS